MESSIDLDLNPEIQASVKERVNHIERGCPNRVILLFHLNTENFHSWSNDGVSKKPKENIIFSPLQCFTLFQIEPMGIDCLFRVFIGLQTCLIGNPPQTTSIGFENGEDFFFLHPKTKQVLKLTFTDNFEILNLSQIFPIISILTMLPF